ncbi:unnamed protein product [Fusarium graminearum]|uniref:Uncharacterized protein n=1 Tax=Gibberella zeae TaxID=5518 RepID=A0A9N8WY49_GIBZA|nr:unnamed protein product [Fusarium graminearum]
MYMPEAELTVFKVTSTLNLCFQSVQLTASITGSPIFRFVSMQMSALMILLFKHPFIPVFDANLVRIRSKSIVQMRQYNGPR